MARKSDYDTIISSKPIYYGGYGILAPEGMSEIDALKDSSNNPFSKLTYAVISKDERSRFEARIDCVNFIQYGLFTRCIY